MSKFCSKCGNELAEEAIFCSACGYSGETTEKIDATQPNIEIGNQPTTVAPVKKKNPFKIVIPIVAVALVIAIGLGIVFFKGTNKGIITTNKDGEKVFNFNVEKYVEMYNDANEADLKFSFFEKDSNSSGDLLYSFADNLIIFFVGENDYNDNIEQIKLNIESPSEGIIPNGVCYLLRAIYPELTTSEATDIASDAKDWGVVGKEYKDIEVMYEYDDDNDYEHWFIYPKE